MKTILIILMFILQYKHLSSQQLSNPKPPLDTSILDNWPMLLNPDISKDGKYVCYYVYHEQKYTYVAQATDNTWKKEYKNYCHGFFSTDSKCLIFKSNDTLFFQSLGTDTLNYVTGITSIKRPKSGKSPWLAYQVKNADINDLIIRYQPTGKDQHFSNVIDYDFDDNGRKMLLVIKSEQDRQVFTTLKWVDLQNFTTNTIWQTQNSPDQHIDINGYQINGTGTQAVFTVNERKKDQLTSSIWYYREGMDSAVLKVNNQSPSIDAGLTVQNSAPEFTKDGKYILFQLQELENQAPSPNSAKLDIWGYQDAFLQTTQLVNLRPKKYTAVISVEGTKVIRLEQADDRLIASPVKGDFVMIKNDKKGDRFWLTEPDVYYLVSLKDGTRSKLVETRGPAADFSFSPGGRYLVYYDPVKQGNYYSYDLQTGKLANISAGIFPWSLAFKNEYQSLGTAGNTYNRLNIGIAAWQGNDAYVLVYDNYDLWQLDLQGQKRPVNITNGYGTSHHIKFRIMVKKPDIPIFSDTTMFFMSAFNTINKYNGIYRKSLQQKGGPELLTMQPCTIYHEENLTLPPNAHELDYYSTMPMKAENVNIWMLKRQTATEAPNYFLTSDFKNYTALTNFQPQASYNWLTAELLTWKQSKNITTQGILYKPENFDPKKKYPVLITYYQQFSHRLYEYPMPGFTKNDINIPWFVSHGYLVFTPDIYFIEGKQGQSACDAIVSAAYELIKLSFVDPKKIGIQGHSYGGFMTNYIVTHTNLFAAAIESAGTSNWVSSSLQLGGLEKRASRLPSYENIIGSDLWKRPDLYLENSPVLKADKIITPLIICHSKTDTAVPWEQAVELFIAMRRLGKKVWMLQYDEGDHGAWEKNDYVDYTIRVTQFFDHYLKGTPPPIWMTQGIPARKKGIETGYELDTSGKQP